MLAEAIINWDVAGIIASFATLVTALVGGTLLLRTNTKQYNVHARVAAAKVDTKVDEAIVTLSDTLTTHMHHVNGNLALLGRNQESLQAGQEVMFGLLAELDAKVTKPAVRTRKTIAPVSQVSQVSQETADALIGGQR